MANTLLALGLTLALCMLGQTLLLPTRTQSLSKGCLCN